MIAISKYPTAKAKYQEGNFEPAELVGPYDKGVIHGHPDLAFYAARSLRTGKFLSVGEDGNPNWTGAAAGSAERLTPGDGNAVIASRDPGKENGDPSATPYMFIKG